MFFVQNASEYEQACAITTENQVDNGSFFPVYNGGNLDFFKENVFYNRNDFEVEPVSFKDIHIRGEVNDSFFGWLSILPGGEVYGNLNLQRLGVLGKDLISAMVQEEIGNRVSWRKVRKYVEPCRKCMYAQICPPVSNYNLLAKRYNFCHIL